MNAPRELRDRVKAVLARDKSTFDLDSEGWILGSKLSRSEDSPYLSNGFVGVRFATTGRTPSWIENQFHAADFTDTNGGKGSRFVPSKPELWRGEPYTYFALDMRSGTLLAVNDKVATEFRLRPQGALLEGWKHDLVGNQGATRIQGSVMPGAHAGQPKDWPEYNSDLNPPQPSTETLDALADIQIDGPLVDQLAVRSFIYYLRSEIPRSTSEWKGPSNIPPYQLSPMGRSSLIYDGHVFWDADQWLIPALAFVEPQPLMDGFANYRTLRVQAKGLPFSWESASSGKELAPLTMRREIHVAGDVLWGLNFMKALGAKVPELPRTTKRVAAFFNEQLTPRPGSNGLYDLKNVVSPDENRTHDNDLYTNILAQSALDQAGIKKQLYLPRDSQTFITYERDPLRAYKQADAVLSIYPLQYANAEKDAELLLSRFENKVIPNGPAMTDSIHSIIRSRLGEADAAYALWVKSWKPFVVGPLMLFSEKRISVRTYFTTGAAGSLQAVVYGFLGFRVDSRPVPGSVWTKKLLNGRWLSITPHLPSAWKSAKFKNFMVLGKRYTLTVSRENGAQRVTVK